MPELVTVAAVSEGPLRLKERWEQDGSPDDHPVWPTRSDLDEQIASEAHKRGWTVLEVHEPPMKRGPLMVDHVDPETGEVVRTAKWQLYAHVTVEPTGGAGREAQPRADA